jgi:hypothetical protein
MQPLAGRPERTPWRAVAELRAGPGRCPTWCARAVCRRPLRRGGLEASSARVAGRAERRRARPGARRTLAGCESVQRSVRLILGQIVSSGRGLFPDESSSSPPCATRPGAARRLRAVIEEDLRRRSGGSDASTRESRGGLDPQVHCAAAQRRKWWSRCSGRRSRSCAGLARDGLTAPPGRAHSVAALANRRPVGCSPDHSEARLPPRSRELLDIARLP